MTYRTEFSIPGLPSTTNASGRKHLKCNGFVAMAPVAWSRPRFNSRSKSVFNATKYRRFSADLKATLTRCSGQAEPVLGDLALTIRFYLEPPKRKVRESPSVRPDLDNYVKAFCDAANDVLWRDDAQVVSLHAEKVYDFELRTVGIEFTLEEIEWVG